MKRIGFDFQLCLGNELNARGNSRWLLSTPFLASGNTVSLMTLKKILKRQYQECDYDGRPGMGAQGGSGDRQEEHERTSRVEDKPEVVTRVGVSSRG